MSASDKQRPSSNGYQPQFMDSATFDKQPYKENWLIKGILAAQRPGVVGGPKKSLKTSLSVDAAISLVTGRPFLGLFKVPIPQKVAYLSGETNEADMQNLARRICTSKKCPFPGCTDLFWDFTLPRFGRKAEVTALQRALERNKVKVVFFDALYLCLLNGSDATQASNLFATGPLLHRVSRACLDVGATPVFLHHMTKTRNRARATAHDFEPPDLDDLAFAGIAEFARQWILLCQRAPFRPETGDSSLCMSVGGGAGQTGCWDVDVHEGALQEDFSGRVWRVKVSRRASPSVEATAKPRRRESESASLWG